MKKIIYIGRFTPLGGGVTNKNAGLYAALASQLRIKKIDLTPIRSGSLRTLITAISAFLGRRNVLIIGTAGRMRRVLTHILFVLNRNTIERSLLIVMGGQFAGIIAKDKDYETWVRHYKRIYVETFGMVKQLKQLGFKNVSLFPNCRQRPCVGVKIKPRDGKLKCVCFSMIYPEKGIDTVLEAAKRMPDVLFDFWGPVRENYKDEFLSSVDSLPNCTYKGVFQVDGDNVYGMLNQYDLLLFPTRMTSEGVPGTLVEAKIAALPAVISDCAYNAELVTDGVDGIVMKNDSAKALMDCIKMINEDDDLLRKMKIGASESSTEYYYDKYIESILGLLLKESM